MSAGEFFSKARMSFGDEIELTAGKDFLDTPVLGVRVVDDRNSIKNVLKSDAVIFHSAHGRKCSILDAAEALCLRKAGVMAVCRNECYIYELDQLRMLCNRLALPLIEVKSSDSLPWLVKFFYDEIIEFYENVIGISKMLQEIIRMPELYMHYGKTLSENGFFEKSDYCVAVCRFISKKGSVPLQYSMTQLYRFIESGIAMSGEVSAVLSVGCQFAVIFADSDPENATDTLKKGLEAIPEELSAGYDVFIGVSDMANGIIRLPVLLRFAANAAVLQMNRGNDRRAADHSEQLFNRFIISVKEREPVDCLIKETLGKLVDYDRRNDMAYVKLLKAYFRNNCSIQETSKELFIHRNSVNYALRRIETIMGVNFSDANTRAWMIFAIGLSELSGNNYLG